MADREHLLDELDEGPWLLLRMLADRDEEDGRADYAAGWRWLALHQRWPVQVNSNWEWWREKHNNDDEPRVFSCSLPRMLMDAVRKTRKTPPGTTCQFESASAALACAAFCAGKLIGMFGTIDD